jgi:CDP-4-dehydro-6-deoxyglucose reductase, E1
MSALVVGASGLIGGALARALSSAGEEVFGTYFSRVSRDATIQLDVRDSEAVAKCVESSTPRVILLAVGGADDGKAGELTTLHVTGTRNVADAADRVGARIVYLSSDDVFDGTKGPYAEHDPPRPLSVLGRAKVEAERLLRMASPRHLIVRSADVFGWDRESDNFAMLVWDRLQTGHVLEAAGNERITPTLVGYLAEAAVRLIQAGESGVLNVVGGDTTTPAEFARRVARALGLDASLVRERADATSDTSQRGHRRGLEPSRLREILGTNPPGLDECLRRLRRQWRADTHVLPGKRVVADEADRLRAEILAKTRAYWEIAHRREEFVPFESRIQYAGRVFGPEEMSNLVESALDFWLTMGPYAEQMEHRLRRYFGARDTLFVTSGSTANLTAVMTLLSSQLEHPLVPGDEVITPAVTFPSTLSPIVHSGLVPVFVDCAPGTYNIDPQQLEGAVSPKTRAIVVPHTLGNPCDMDIVCEVAERHGLYLVEDTCDALGSRFRNRLVGTFGDLATLSFYPAHHITTGEGGAVVVNRLRFARIARSVRDWGRDCWCAPGESNTCGKRFGWRAGDLPFGYDHKFTYSNLGYNFKPTDMQAAVGLAQLDRLPRFIADRKRNFARLHEGLQPYRDRLLLPMLDARSDPSWFGYPITVKPGVARLDLVQWLERAKIETRLIFGGNILRQPAFRNIRHRVFGMLSESDRVMRDAFFIGVYPGLSEEMIDFVLERFAEFFAR